MSGRYEQDRGHHLNRDFNRDYNQESGRENYNSIGGPNEAGRYSEGNSYYGGAGNFGGGMNQYGEQGRHSGRGPKGYKRSDERIKEDVSERLMHDSWVDASEIEIEVKDGEVTLTGTVQSREEKRRAEDAVDRVSGIRDIHNQIRVQNQNNATETSRSGTNKAVSS